MKQYTGKTLDEVLQTIATNDNCKVEEITYTVTEEKKGILGLGSSVTVEAYTPRDIKDFTFDYLGNYFNLPIDTIYKVYIYVGSSLLGY